MSESLIRSARVRKQVTVPPLTLAEAGEIPIEQLVHFAVREGRRPRPIYTAHKWFARRLGSVFRSLLIGVTKEPGAGFGDLYYGNADLRGISVLDPFVGGGTSVFEASRLGCTAYGCDVDPVACAVSRMELGAAAIPDLQPTLKALERSVGEKLKRFHRQGDEIILHHFWVQLVDCDDCGAIYQAHPSFILADDGKKRHAICSNCGEISAVKSGQAEFCCGTCGAETICSEGHVEYGKAKCPHCGHSEPLIAIGRREGRPNWLNFAVETVLGTMGGHAIPIKDRKLRRTTDDDLLLYAEASRELIRAEAAGDLLLPEDAIDVAGWSDDRLISYGYRHWRDLFNDRQLLHLGLLSKAISELEQPIRGAVAMAFSDHLTTNCMMASYAGGWRRLTPLFSMRAFRHIQRPVELNPWMDRTGRGSFPNAIRKLGRAVAFAREPKEPIDEKGFQTVELRQASKVGEIHLGSARNLSFLADGSIDVVMTDPPYFDNIAYSDLAQFFAPWLRLLDVIRDIRRADINAQSLVARRGCSDTVTRYTEGLGEAFREIARVLRPRGIVAFSYRHTDPAAWQALAEAIAVTDLHVTVVLPMPGEAGNGLHAQGERGLWDAVFILRRGRRPVPDQLAVSTADIALVERQVEEWKIAYGSLAIPFNDIDATALRRAALVGKALKKAKIAAKSEMTTLKVSLASTYANGAEEFLSAEN